MRAEWRILSHDHEAQYTIRSGSVPKTTCSYSHLWSPPFSFHSPLIWCAILSRSFCSRFKRQCLYKRGKFWLEMFTPTFHHFEAKNALVLTAGMQKISYLDFKKRGKFEMDFHLPFWKCDFTSLCVRRLSTRPSLWPSLVIFINWFAAFVQGVSQQLTFKKSTLFRSGAI